MDNIQIQSGTKVQIFWRICKKMSRKFLDNLHFAKSGVKFPASFGTTIGDLWDIFGLSVASLMCLYNNAAKSSCNGG